MTKGNPTNTPSIDDRELIEVLGKHRRIGGVWVPNNPDGKRAADRLESLLSERDKLEERVRELEGRGSVEITRNTYVNRTANNG